jgi:uncharacterized membrane protein YkoI
LRAIKDLLKKSGIYAFIFVLCITVAIPFSAFALALNTNNKTAESNEKEAINEKENNENDANETAMLKDKAVLTEQQAVDIAKNNSNGEVQKITLGDENGTVVYEVKIKTGNKVTEVKVDAENGNVLPENNDGEYED